MLGRRHGLASALLIVALSGGATSCNNAANRESVCEHRLFVAYSDVNRAIGPTKNSKLLDKSRAQLIDALVDCSSPAKVEMNRGMTHAPAYVSRSQMVIATADPEMIQRDVLARLQSGGVVATECIDLMLSAARYSHPSLMSRLVERGCRPDGRDDFGASPLAFSIGGAQTDGENTRWILEQGISATEILPTGYHALVDAIANKDIGAVRELLAFGASPRVNVPKGGDISEFARLSGVPAISEMIQDAMEKQPD